LKSEIYTQDFSDEVFVTTNSPAIIGMTQIDDIEKVKHGVMLEFDDTNDEYPITSSPIST
jgi:hypothetical protein